MDRKFGVFISYSHDDTKLVSPIVELIRAMRKDLVFLDFDTIQKGKLWEPQLNDALSESEIVILFWCNHSATSEDVKKEYQKALDTKKDILPVLLDDTVLEGDLAKYQWIDFRDLISHDGFRNPGPLPTRSEGLSAAKLSIMVLLPILTVIISYATYRISASSTLTVLFTILSVSVFAYIAFRVFYRGERSLNTITNASMLTIDQVAANAIVEKLNVKISLRSVQG